MEAFATHISILPVMPNGNKQYAEISKSLPAGAVLPLLNGDWYWIQTMAYLMGRIDNVD